MKHTNRYELNEDGFEECDGTARIYTIKTSFTAGCHYPVNPMDLLNIKDWSPRSFQINKEGLDELLREPRNKVLFCWHHWIYWTFGESTKLHRVCKKCYKKQQNRDVVKRSGFWHKDMYFE